MDPLIPGLTDSEASLAALCQGISAHGGQRVTASYLFLRQSNMRWTSLRHGRWSFVDMVRDVYTDSIQQYCGGGSIRVPAASYRRQGYDRLKTAASAHGLSVTLCHCKNPDLTTDRCHPVPPNGKAGRTQQHLFVR